MGQDSQEIAMDGNLHFKWPWQHLTMLERNPSSQASWKLISEIAVRKVGMQRCKWYQAEIGRLCCLSWCLICRRRDAVAPGVKEHVCWMRWRHRIPEPVFFELKRCGIYEDTLNLHRPRITYNNFQFQSDIYRPSFTKKHPHRTRACVESFIQDVACLVVAKWAVK